MAVVLRETNICSVLLLFAGTFSVIVGAGLNEACTGLGTTGSDCTVANSECLARECEGIVCQCTSGYLPSGDFSMCIPARLFIGDPCGTTIGRCNGLNKVCNSSGLCDCRSGLEPDINNRHCRLAPSALLGESCTVNTDCFLFPFDQSCEGGTCSCISGTRAATEEEFQAITALTQCRVDGYSLDICNGVNITAERLANISMTTTTAPTIGTPVTTVRQTGLFLPCVSNADCPASSACMPRDCEGNICLCDVGFWPNANEDACVQTVYHNDPCGETTGICTGQFMRCSSLSDRCECFPGTTPTATGDNCLLRGLSYLNGTCTNDADCRNLFEQSCQSGVCTCRPGSRDATPEELVAYPRYLAQCRVDSYSLDTCDQTSSTSVTVKSTPNKTKTSTAARTTTPAPTRQNVSLFDTCNSTTQCPVDSSCISRDCVEYQCMCDDGLAPDVGDQSCVPAVYFGDPCGPSVGRCSGVFTVCISGTCGCNSPFVVDHTGRNCVLMSQSLLGGSCSNTMPCMNVFEQSCVDGFCTCLGGLRNATDRERLVFFKDPNQCMDNNNTLALFDQTSTTTVMVKSTTPTKVTTPTPTTTPPPTAPTTLTPSLTSDVNTAEAPDENTPLIVGSSVGGGVSVPAVFIVVICCFRRRKKKDNSQPTPKPGQRENQGLPLTPEGAKGLPSEYLTPAASMPTQYITPVISQPSEYLTPVASPLQRATMTNTHNEAQTFETIEVDRTSEEGDGYWSLSCDYLTPTANPVGLQTRGQTMW